MRVTRVLTVDAAPSGVKARLLARTAGPDDARPTGHGADPSGSGWRLVAAWDRPDTTALGRLVAGVDDGRLTAVAHRVAYGGHHRAVVVDERVLGRLRASAALSPPTADTALAALEECSAATDVPQVACDDTAFGSDLPPAAATFAVPREWVTQLGVRRVGSHGLTHRRADRIGRALAGERRPRRVVTAHIGASTSLMAVLNGTCVDTTTGFTPLDGPVSLTGSGRVDPGLVLHVQERLGWSPARMRLALALESGLAGLSGLTGDVRGLLAAERAGDQWAGLACDVFVHSLRASVAAMAAALDGLDLLVFTGGVGEGSPEIRQRVSAGLGFLGVGELRGEPVPGTGEGPEDRVLTGPDSAVAVAVVHARDDVEMAETTRSLLGGRVAV